MAGRHHEAFDAGYGQGDQAGAMVPTLPPYNLLFLVFILVSLFP
jgi:hypothetical protein